MSAGGVGVAPPLRVSRQPSGEPEIFHSIQGEGPSVGTPSVFLRLATCNLSCSWCDTKYTWDWQHYEYEREVMELSHEQVERQICGYPCSHLVITGGEPLLQQQGLLPLVQSLDRRGFSFEVETNGTVVPDPRIEPLIDQWNVSPKLSNSGIELRRREIPEALHSFARRENSYFKFVVAEPADVKEVRALAQDYGIGKDRVVLMPEGRDADVLLERGKWLSQVCVEEGFRFTPRLHILLWGDKRAT